jgi:PiT family inorganic phosphate transporter
MPDRPTTLTKRTLDKDLDKLTQVEDASKYVSRKLVAPGIGLVFLGLAMLFAGVYVFDRPGAGLVIAAAALAAYMAMNIGANDVTNNVGAAVGARAMTMGQALVIAAIFEILGATIGGGAVVKTISSSILDASQIPAGDAGLDHDGGADGGRTVDQPRDLAERARLDHPLDRRRGHRRRASAPSGPVR